MDPIQGRSHRRHLTVKRLWTYCLTEVRALRLQGGMCFNPFTNLLLDVDRRLIPLISQWNPRQLSSAPIHTAALDKVTTSLGDNTDVQRDSHTLYEKNPFMVQNDNKRMTALQYWPIWPS